MKLRIRLFCMLSLLFLSTVLNTRAGDPAEFQGQFEKVLVPNVEDFEKVVFKFTPTGNIKGLKSITESSHAALGRLYDPQTEKTSVLAVLIENEDEAPEIYVDLNGDGAFADSEKTVFKQDKTDNPYLWNATVPLPVKDSFFSACPLFLQYFKSITIGKMTPDDRLVTQSTEVFARGSVDVKGKKVLVQYSFNFSEKKIDPQFGVLGVDVDGNGDVDMDELSPEAAMTKGNTVVFRAGEMYLSTKTADLGKNRIVMREHESKDYKRLELRVGTEFPEFAFVDFAGKKRKFSEFRGKYVLLDVWGLWCPACRDELPYIREALKRFSARKLEILGLNTDDQFTPDSLKKAIEQSGMKWNHATFESVFDFLSVNLRIRSFPSTFLIGPDGKIISMGRVSRDESSLRGESLLETLDEILPN